MARPGSDSVSSINLYFKFASGLGCQIKLSSPIRFAEPKDNPNWKRSVMPTVNEVVRPPAFWTRICNA